MTNAEKLDMTEIIAVSGKRCADLPSRSPKWAYGLCIGLVSVAFSMFVFTLDRYPSFFFDEPFFNIPAQRYVDGRSFTYNLHSEAPNKDRMLAYQVPFFFRMQILVFKVIGISHFSCRIPGYLAGHLSVLLLCLFLLRNGFVLAPVGLSLFWIGDRSIQNIMLGRPEGLALLFAVLAFIFLMNALRSEGKLNWFMCGCCLGFSVGFSPASVFFAFPVLFAAFWRRRRPWRQLGAIFLGGVVPVALFVACWMPDLIGAVDQFLWYATYSTQKAVSGKSIHLLHVWIGLQWARPWIAFLLMGNILAIAVALVCGPAASDDQERNPEYRVAVPVVSACFGMASLLAYFFSSMHLYYLVLFTVWPIVSVLTCIEPLWRESRVRAASASICLALMIVCWFPSLGWNVMRCREAILCRRILDKQPIVEMLKSQIPAGARTEGDPSFFVVARNAGLEFYELPFFCDDPGMPPSGDKWLFVSQMYDDMLKKYHPDLMKRRKQHFRGFAFQGSKYTEMRYFIYEPESP
jgi:hypothetical protein